MLEVMDFHPQDRATWEESPCSFQDVVLALQGACVLWPAEISLPASWGWPAERWKGPGS